LLIIDKKLVKNTSEYEYTENPVILVAYRDKIGDCIEKINSILQNRRR